jgi:quinol monooxygenase YgiN
MIMVIGTIEVDLADRVRFLEEKQTQVMATRAEAGCLDYAFAADSVDAGLVRLVERWESMADLEAHVAGLRAAGRPDQPPVPSKMRDLTVYEAQAVSPPWA